MIEAHLSRMEDVSEDLADSLAIAQRALARVQAEVAEIRSQAQGQQELPLPLAGGGEAAETDGSGRLSRAAAAAEIRQAVAVLSNLATSSQGARQQVIYTLGHRLETVAAQL